VTKPLQYVILNHAICYLIAVRVVLEGILQFSFIFILVEQEPNPLKRRGSILAPNRDQFSKFQPKF
jgi:hypothetical protein